MISRYCALFGKGDLDHRVHVPGCCAGANSFSQLVLRIEVVKSNSGARLFTCMSCYLAHTAHRYRYAAGAVALYDRSASPPAHMSCF